MVTIPTLDVPDFPGLETDSSSSGISSQDAQKIALLYEAALNRKADNGGLNYWIDRFEAGESLVNISKLFVASPEFAAAFGNPSKLSNLDLINVFYSNVLGRQGEASGVAYWKGQLDSGSPRETVLVQFALSDENKTGSTYVGTLYDDGSGVWLF